MVMAANMVNHMGRTVLTGLQGLAPAMAARGDGGEPTKDRATMVGGFGKAAYTLANVAQLMGFCGIVRARDISRIWGIFQCTKEYDK